MKKRVITLLTTLCMAAALLTACGKTETDSVKEETTENSKTTVEATESIEETENLTGNNAILVVSFGTSYNDSRELTIGGIEKAIEAAYPDYEVRRAFTSQIIIDKVKERDGIEIDNVEEALDRAVEDGITNLVIQPTHLMNGYEYTDLEEAVKDYEDKFEQVVIANPLLTSDNDFEAVIAAITKDTASYDDGETAIVFMGHGTEADSNGVYAKMQEMITADGYENYYVGTVEATPSLDDVIAAIKDKGYSKVVLEPLMVVAGDHANNDMAGDEDDSWKSILTAEGYEVTCILEGLGQKEDIQQIYVAHTKDAMEQMAE